MHELSIASTILESALQFVERHAVKKVVHVRLLVGELTCLEAEQLRFCYSAIIHDTALAESTLEIEKGLAEVKCPHCSYRGAPKYWADVLEAEPIPTLQCPQCGRAAEATRGHECEIKTIKFVRQEPYEICPNVQSANCAGSLP
jgi:hydrogenase nickel incorporation protein HypA/HybF